MSLGSLRQIDPWGFQSFAGGITDKYQTHDDVIKWKHYLRYWPFVQGIHRSPVNSPHKGQWRGALMFSLIYVWTNGWVNNRDAGDLGRYRVHYSDVDVIWNHMAWSRNLMMSSMSLTVPPIRTKGSVMYISWHLIWVSTEAIGRAYITSKNQEIIIFALNLSWTIYLGPAY